jgi:hypothetical protein
MNGMTKGDAATQPDGAPTAKSGRSAPRDSARRRSVGFLVAAVAEGAVVAAYALFLLTGGLVGIEEQYLRPHLQAYEFTQDRQDQEVTYYSRTCTPRDVSTLSSRDLYLTNASDPRTAYDTFLRHGAVVFPSVLSRDTSARLREFVIAKNLAQRPGESEFLHSPMHRYVLYSTRI